MTRARVADQTRAIGGANGLAYLHAASRLHIAPPMNDEPSLNRPLLATRTRRTMLTIGAALATMFAGGIGVGMTLHNAPRVEHISVAAPPVTVTVPTAAPPSVTVTAPPPLAPEPAPVVAPTNEPPRARTPRLLAYCTLTTPGYEQGACTWDDGFPAISADGTLIAHKHIPDDAGRGNPGLEIWFIDAATGKTVSTSVILSPDEYEVADGTNDKSVAKLYERVVARGAKVQQTLDAGDYRTMAHLGSGGPFQGNSPEPRTTTPTTTYADLDGSGAVRIVDPATNSVIWQHTFGVPGGATNDDGESMCGGWGLWNMDLWWDPPTHVVLAAEWYRTGGCMCSDEGVVEVARVPDDARGR